MNLSIQLVFLSSSVSWCQPQRFSSGQNKGGSERGSERGSDRGQGRKLSFEKAQVSQSLPSDDYDSYYYYYDEEPLPSGPTRRPPLEYEYYDEEEPLPAGPTREPPLPSGPTRRPGQPTTAPVGQQGPTVHPALNQLLNLPLLTTPRPRRGDRKASSLRQGGRKLDINDQNKLFSSQHFIAPPPLNAGALPLALQSDQPRNQFPPFRERGNK